jgi:hypothetical protein
MRRLLDDVAAGRIDLIAVVEMERLCRASDLRDWATISTTFREAGVPVATPERIFNLETAEDDFEADLRGILSKREKRKLLERTHRGLEQARDAGRFIGGQPMLGYRYDHATRKIVPDPETVPLAQRIFESNLGAWALCRQLRSEGSPSGTRRLSASAPIPGTSGSESTRRPADRCRLACHHRPGPLAEVAEEAETARPPRCAERETHHFLSGIIRCANWQAVVGAPIAPSKTGMMPLFVYKCLEPRKCPGKGGQLSVGWLTCWCWTPQGARRRSGDLEGPLRPRDGDGGSRDATAERDA